MTAAQVMHEMDRLPPAEQEKVVSFARQLPSRKPLSGAELTTLAQRMVEAADPATAIVVEPIWSKASMGMSDTACQVPHGEEVL